MPEKRSHFIKVDDLLPQVSVEQAAAFYGVALPELHRTGDEIRTRCFLNCGKCEETGDRALAIKADSPEKKWHCHQYECKKGGNLVGLCDLMKPGENAAGRPRGDRFKAIRDDLVAMVGGVLQGESVAVATPATPQPAEPVEIKVNLLLAASENERARALVNLDEKFVTDVAGMNPAASAYFRRRPFLSSEVCEKWRCGYLPRDTGGDKAGGTMRGKVVYPMLSDGGQVLTWFGRDPEHEDKHGKWVSGGKQGKEPAKFHFVKGYHRGLELFGQHQFREEAVKEKLAGIGLLVVEGPNDVIALNALGVPAVGLCSNTITKEQAAKASQLAYDLDGGLVTLMLDCDAEGENGAQQSLGLLAQHGPVRLAWSGQMHDGRFASRQPESLNTDEWEYLHGWLRRDA